MVALVSAPFVVFGLVVCFGWSWAWNVGALPLFLLLGRDSGFSPVPDGLHLAVQRGSEQLEGHTLASPPSEVYRVLVVFVVVTFRKESGSVCDA